MRHASRDTTHSPYFTSLYATPPHRAVLTGLAEIYPNNNNIWAFSISITSWALATCQLFRLDNFSLKILEFGTTLVPWNFRVSGLSVMKDRPRPMSVLLFVCFAFRPKTSFIYIHRFLMAENVNVFGDFIFLLISRRRIMVKFCN